MNGGYDVANRRLGSVKAEHCYHILSVIVADTRDIRIEQRTSPSFRFAGSVVYSRNENHLGSIELGLGKRISE